jgi:hydrogenase nickel incorporation protein HypB
MFLTSEVMVVSKSDLLPYLPFSVDAVVKDARAINSDIEVLEVSSLKGEGMEEWCNWLLAKAKEKKAASLAES